MKKNILALVDCNNFYVSCEKAFNGAIQTKPTIVLSISRSKNPPTHNVKNVAFMPLVVLRQKTYPFQFFNERNVNDEGTTSAPSRHQPPELAGP